MVHEEVPLWFPRRGSSDGGTNVVLKTPRVPKGETWRITRVTFEDETTAFTLARVFRGTEQVPYGRSEQLAPAAGVLYWDDHEFEVSEGEEVGVRFNGTTTADILIATFEGMRVLRHA